MSPRTDWGHWKPLLNQDPPTGALARGLRVPDDLSIFAIDMSERAALMSAPAMTTVSPDEREMGRIGVELLISRLEGGSGPHAQKLFEGALHARGTSGPAPSRFRGQ
ncbi:substrate-binding domain-containing protein [Terrabacter sp. GCM10028922]|uniref:substrate-binding domain-containing protein n=1 Tax=Terrabacter sp. GCM10028922 TaxID=3273428 RepID=UPI003605F427